MSTQLTNTGRRLLVRALVNEPIIFTKIQIGNGNSQNPLEATELINPIISANFESFEVGSEYASFSASFNNNNIDTGFRITEIGIFAQDPDDENNEILYAIENKETSQADYFPGITDRVLEMTYEGKIYIGNAENITALINDSIVFATKADLYDHTNAPNPHNINKATVGLENVPNVSTNDQTPEFTESVVLTDINSGEKLSILFGKIKKAISAIISHLRTTGNPHGTTADDINAAKKSHQHSTNDLTSGTLGVARGGTGVNTLSALKASLGLPIVTGSYTGNGTNSGIIYRKITLNFTPKAVYVSCASNTGAEYSGLATDFADAAMVQQYAKKNTDITPDAISNKMRVAICEYGFYVFYAPGDNKAKTNVNGEVYNYIAIM